MIFNLRKIHSKFLFIIFVMYCSSTRSNAQDSIPKTYHFIPKTIYDIPHKTFREKLMWPHRSFAFKVTKEHPVNYNPDYIKSHYKRMVITLPVSTRFLLFTLTDPKTGSKLTFAPNLQYNLGISISSRWASFIMNSGVKLFTGNTGTKGKTTYHDYQLNLYGRKFTTDMFVQFYSGFYIQNSRSYKDYSGDNKFAIREDVNALNLGVSSYYIINHKKFSYGSSFSFAEQQKKSAGSILLGIYYSYFAASGTPSLVSSPFRNSFDTTSLIRNGHTNNFGFNLGYIYTLVFLKKCNATVSLSQGVGGQQMGYERDDKSTIHKLIGGAGKLNVRLGLRYDNGRYFIGTMVIFDYYLFRGKTNSTLDYSFGKFMGFIGYRFSVLKPEKRILRKLKLIDY
jgi:hypothetical protein